MYMPDRVTAQNIVMAVNVLGVMEYETDLNTIFGIRTSTKFYSNKREREEDAAEMLKRGWVISEDEDDDIVDGRVTLFYGENKITVMAVKYIRKELTEYLRTLSRFEDCSENEEYLDDELCSLDRVIR